MAYVAVALAVFRPALTRALQYDDYGFLEEVSRPSVMLHLLASSSDTLYRPVLLLWFWLWHAIFGLHAIGYHLVDFGLLIGVVAMEFTLARRVGLSDLASIVAVGFVGLHTTFTIPLGWAAASSSLLVDACGAGAILALVRPRPTIRHQVTACALLLLALGSRQVAVVIPAATVAMRLVATEPASPRRRVRQAVGPTLPMWGVLGTYVGVLAASGAHNTKGYYRLGFQKVPQNVRDLARFSTGLSGFGHTSRLYDLVVIGFWIVVVIGAVLAARRGMLVGIGGLAWYAMGIAPVALLVNQSESSWYNDFAILGLALVVGIVADTALQQIHLSGLWPSLGPGLVGLALAVLVVLGWRGSRTDLQDSGVRAVGRRTHELILEAKAVDPIAPPNDVLLLPKSERYDDIISRHGDLFRVIYRDPRLVVRYGPATVLAMPGRVQDGVP
jgi:hypothetical protein